MKEKNNMKRVLLIIPLLICLSCKKDTDTNPPEEPAAPVTQNDVRINFTNVAGNAIIRFSKDSAYIGSDPKYLNADNDTFSVSFLKYYISNVRLKKSDGSYFSEPYDTYSYHLINAADSINACKFSLKNVPLGTYVQLEFSVGIDSLRNVSGAQTGPLDPVHKMFWTWNQGYIFFKLEGYSSSAPTNTVHNLQFDIGGFQNPYNNIRTFTLSLTSPSLVVVGDHVSEIHLKTDILEAFKTPTTINFSTDPVMMSLGPGQLVANNYKDMFKLRIIKN